MTEHGAPRTDLDWENLGFAYRDTRCHVRYTWKNGRWDDGVLVEEPWLRLHIAATCLHYGQSVFEGLKAFRWKDGSVHLFRPQENARRLAAGARRICMAEVPETLFMEAVRRVVEANRDYVPPYGTGGALYVRPLLIGSGPQLGVNPAPEYTFLVFAAPVGPYYTSGLKPVRAIVLDQYDRAAPRGVGNIKVAGNYAASLEPHKVAHDAGFAVELYLDAARHEYIEEFGTSNFVGITRDRRYVTPASDSILPSITNKSLQQIARDIGIPVETRPVAFTELPDFAEIGACGTAVVITPVSEIVRGDQVIRTGSPHSAGPVLTELYERITRIQYGDAPDPYGWTMQV